MTKGRILIAENEKVIALDVRSRLTAMGYETCAIVTTGEDAVRKAGETDPDLILMDIMLDGEMDGIDAAASIRAEYGLPVVYMTAHSDEKTLDRAKVTEPFGYIVKPFENRELELSLSIGLYKGSVDRRLRSNERRLATTLNSLGDAVVTTDQQGNVDYLNPAAERLLGWDMTEAEDHAFSEVFTLVSANSGERVEDLSRQCMHGTCVTFGAADDYLLVSAAGRQVPVSGNVSPIVDERGTRKGTVVVFRDITDQKRVERAMRENMLTLRRTLGETVQVLTAVSEKRDPYTAGHQHRVAELSCAIARDMGISGERLEGLRVAGALHDLGKIYIPAEILSKPSILNDIEMGLIRSHPEVGYEILSSVSFPWPVADMVRQHHERLNGSGYPQGLKEDSILFEARILAVADVVEAMSSHRPYRESLGIDQALNEIEKNSGLLYDTKVVETCVTIFRKGNFAFNKK